MNHRRHRPFPAWRTALLAVALVVVTATSIPTARAQVTTNAHRAAPPQEDQQAPGQEPDPAEPPTPEPGALELVDATPWVAPDGTIELTVAATGDVSTAVMRVEIHAPVETAGALRDALDGDVRRRRYASPPIPVGFVPVAADGTRSVQIAVSTTTSGDLTARLRDPGVYPLTLTLETPDGTVLTTVRTPVIRLGTDDDPLPAPRLAVLVEVGVDPTVGPDGSRTITNDELARLERLGSFLALANGGADSERATVSIAAVPDTIDALTASSDPRAAAVLDALDGLTADHRAVGLPYVRVSAQALLDAGLDSFLPPLVALGRGLLDDRLDTAVEDGFWPAADPISPAGAALLADLGVRHLLVDAEPTIDDDAELEPRGPDSGDDAVLDAQLVDAGPRPLEGLDPLDAVSFDGRTAELLTSSVGTRPDGAAIALADLLLRTPAPSRTSADDDRRPTTVVVRLDDVADDAVLRHLLPLLARTDSPVAVGGLELVDATPAADAAPLTLATEGPVDDVRSVAERLRAVDRLVDTFAATVEGQSARAVDLRLRVATALARGLSTDARQALLDAAAASAQETFDAITLAGQTDLNLTSRDGTLPLVLRNEAGFPVRVVVTIRSERLRFPEGDRFEVVLEEEVTRLDVPVEARATGSVPTFVSVLTPDEDIRLDVQQLNVRSTAISGVGLALSLGALAVLLVWWGRSWLRGRRDAGGDPAD